MYKYLLMAVILAFSLQAKASGGTDSGKIAQMYVNGGWTMVHIPNIVTNVRGSKNNPDSCNNNYWFAIEPNDPNYTTLHSTLMAAQIAEKNVHFWVSGCGGQNRHYPKIVSVWLTN
ncbi:hypothetical protein [Pseudoalteromonas luteoviolacea]|uniref:Uncharacterized protein n=1 Tax=Pseudoalteromonas luteoviolacea S4054 TaxID=1129367 RepID=A0A0F6AEK9_9GAMM|nr:hypothetical protein [Pseudoalteromonas luteoviolacea]AOT08313.1 hypothetical protein S4054249_10855 [Pseudoalteromonas luteoviolacea]AOT13229.1 hypothetical protein S40542_10830 [Pseudoalteromonas luteoviolacea]AOT18142.1 hypothetical protein S4054_10830 [Pseudoalteromonas luteoviolacea]KKE84251.1 hypothetical protein N479_10150 [Pseudoalteromonas luteoviolacea S4054]KZN76144.1 hypothetical protein N481_07265 [Pseudoalteromonas luteoviolacea S4047-1]